MTQINTNSSCRHRKYIQNERLSQKLFQQSSNYRAFCLIVLSGGIVFLDERNDECIKNLNPIAERGQLPE